MELKKLTEEIENYHHIKYGFSIKTIQNLWVMSADADELERNCKAAISLGKTLTEHYKQKEVAK